MGGVTREVERCLNYFMVVYFKIVLKGRAVTFQN